MADRRPITPLGRGRAHGARRHDGVSRPRWLLALVPAAFVCWWLSAAHPSLDVRLYHHYALAVTHGSLSGGLPHEYPALAEVVFLAPLALPGLSYSAVFAALMAAALAVACLIGARRGPEGWVPRFLVYLALAAPTVVFARYDLVPALTVLGAVEAARRERWGWAWLWAAVGGAVKIFPVLLLPGFAIAEWRRRGRFPWRRLIATATGAAVAAAVQAVVAPGTLTRPLRYEMARGYEFSSVAATLRAVTRPTHLAWTYAYGNVQLDGRTPVALTAALAVGALLGLSWTWWQVHRQRLTVEAAAAIVLSVVLLTNKSFAPQYLIWVAPLWAYWRLRPGWVMVAGLTGLVTVGYTLVVEAGLGTGRGLLVATTVAAARNLTLAATTVAWARHAWRHRDPRDAPPAGDPAHAAETAFPPVPARALPVT